MASIDGRVADLARRQHGVVSTTQCLALGMTRRQIDRRLAAQRWFRIHRGVYATGPAPLSHPGRYLAATLAAGRGAVLSHRSAASLWDLQPDHHTATHVTSTRKLQRRSGTAPHWTRRLRPDETATRRGVPVTALERTVIDLAELATPEELEEAIRAAERIHGLDRASVDPVIGRRGAGKLLARPRHHTRGHLEKVFLRVLDEEGFERPDMNVDHDEYVLDALWAEQRLVLEIDDYETHHTRDALDADRARDRVLTIDGFTAVRITHTDLTRDRTRLAAHLAALGAPRR
jgi:very-short-patch-repair endonuclease